MSDAYGPVNVVKVVDPRVNTKFLEQKQFAARYGGVDNAFQQLSAQSFSNSSFVWNVTTPSPSTVMNRKMYLRVPVRITFGGTSTGANQALITSFRDGFRAFPISSCVSSSSCILNGVSSDLLIGDVIHPMSRYMDPVHLRNGDFSTFPSALDVSNWIGAAGTSTYNPLASILDWSEGMVMKRGGFPILALANPLSAGAGNALVATLDAEIFEPLVVSPFYLGSENEQGYLGLQTFQIQLNFYNNLINYMWEHLNPDIANWTGAVDFTALGAPQLLVNYITLDPIVSPVVPLAQYPWFKVIKQVTAIGNVANGVTQNIQSQNYQLQRVPDKCYICVRKTQGAQTIADANSYARINSINITFAAKTGILSAATQHDLYMMCRKNGLVDPWPVWSGQNTYNFGDVDPPNPYVGSGSVLCLEFGTDIPNPSAEEAPGTSGTYQFSFNVNYTTIHDQGNPNPVGNVNYELLFIYVDQGIWTITENRSVSQLGVLSREDVLRVGSYQAEGIRELDYNELAKEALYGGAPFIQSLGKAAKNVGKFITEKALPAIEKYGPKAIELASKYGPQLANLLGMGYSEAEARRMLQGKGGMQVGGARMSAAQLKKMALQ